jgi:4-amino-4-deoxy-L-arabinose transferase-like glycosyltransferase
VAVVVVRASYVPRPLRIDEGGYLLIARQWHAGGEFLYGDYFVDRPPLLMLIFKVASLSEWDQAIRVVAIPFAVLFVLSGWRAGRLLGGPAGGRWAALVAAGLMCSPGLAADQADGELFGAALVMAAIALALSAWGEDVPARRLWTAGAAGAAALAAPLVKQNLLEGVLFLAGLVVLASWRRDGQARRVLDVARGAFLGALVPCTVLVLWLILGAVRPAAAWHDLIGFRGAALEAIWADGSDALAGRGFLLLALGLITGLVPVMVAWARGTGRALPGATPERAVVTVLFGFGLAAIAAGGSYWPPYLLQLAPATVLAVGAMAPLASAAGAWMRAGARTVLTAAALGTVAAVVVHATVPSVWYSERIGEWLAAAKEPGDTGFVAYGHASVLAGADMSSPYPHLWSVPMRTFDPEQSRLRATLSGTTAPAWIVQVNGFNAWRIDDDGRLVTLVRERYRVVAEVCGSPVWLRQDLSRELPAPPPC